MRPASSVRKYKSQCYRDLSPCNTIDKRKSIEYSVRRCDNTHSTKDHGFNSNEGWTLVDQHRKSNTIALYQIPALMIVKFAAQTSKSRGAILVDKRWVGLQAPVIPKSEPSWWMHKGLWLSCNIGCNAVGGDILAQDLAGEVLAASWI